jgi:hypothetical protein
VGATYHAVVTSVKIFVSLEEKKEGGLGVLNWKKGRGVYGKWSGLLSHVTTSCCGVVCEVQPATHRRQAFIT